MMISLGEAVNGDDMGHHLHVAAKVPEEGVLFGVSSVVNELVGCAVAMVFEVGLAGDMSTAEDRFMPALGPREFRTKLVTAFPENAERSLHVTGGLMLFNGGTSGLSLSLTLMDASTLTGMRIGVVSGVSVRYLV